MKPEMDKPMDKTVRSRWLPKPSIKPGDIAPQNLKTFPRVKIYTPEQIKEIRGQLRESRPTFARRFLVSSETVKGWETGRRNQQGPALVIMQQLEAIVDERKRQHTSTLENIRRRNHA